MQDIRMIDADEDKTRKRLGSDRYDVYFELSEVPPIDWKRIFDRLWADWRAYEEGGKPSVRIGGKYLIITCDLDLIAGVHLPQLKLAIAGTNTGYREHLAKIRKQADEERRRIAEALGRLTFDD